MKPEKFFWGFATNAFQIEGGRSLDGRTPSIWDDFTQNKNNQKKYPGLPLREIKSIEIAADFYHQYPIDLRIMKDLKINLFAYYIDWARIVPHPNEINKKGINFYHQVFAECQQQNIMPMITLLHWDWPMWLEVMGGLKNASTFCEHFRFYVRNVFRYLGKKCNWWVVTSENLFTISAYIDGVFPPGETNNYDGFAVAFHTLNIIANIARQELEAAKINNWVHQDAKLGTDFDYCPGINISNNEHVEQIYDQWNLNFLLDPLFKGTYPAVFTDFLQNNDINLQIGKNDLLALKKHPLDFICWNYYRPQYFAEKQYKIASVNEQIPTQQHFSKQFQLIWPKVNPINQKKVTYTKWNWLVEPNQIINGLTKIKNEYDVPVIIGENGYGDFDKVDQNKLVYDHDRINYLKMHVAEFMKARTLDLNLIGYCMWTYCDIFSPSAGYKKRYGVVRVNFDDPKRRRTPKLSYAWYRTVVASDGELILDSYDDKLLIKYQKIASLNYWSTIVNHKQ